MGRCGQCEACSAPNCGKCVYCLDMRRFGGPGHKKKCSINRKCRGVPMTLPPIQVHLQVIQYIHTILLNLWFILIVYTYIIHNHMLKQPVQDRGPIEEQTERSTYV